jgi:hypothetical protein
MAAGDTNVGSRPDRERDGFSKIKNFENDEPRFSRNTLPQIVPKTRRNFKRPWRVVRSSNIRGRARLDRIFALWQLGVIVLLCTKLEFSGLPAQSRDSWLYCSAAIFVVGLVRPEIVAVVKHVEERR